MRALLDVNALIALLDEEHVHHAAQLARLTSKGHQYLGMPAPTAAGAIRWRDVKSASSTDALLLSTAVAYGCRLVTFDAGIALKSVTGARTEHLVVLG
jgi:predicted nucleic acid-binding protein